MPAFAERGAQRRWLLATIQSNVMRPCRPSPAIADATMSGTSHQTIEPAGFAL